MLVMPEGWQSLPHREIFERFGVSTPPEFPYEVVTTAPALWHVGYVLIAHWACFDVQQVRYEEQN